MKITSTFMAILMFCAVLAFNVGCSNTGKKNNSSSMLLLDLGQQATYTITYEDNGSTSGNVPVDSNQYLSGQTVTVLGNTGTPPLTKTGYSFIGWQVNGSGTTFTQGQIFVMGSANVTLYALWAVKIYAIGDTGPSGVGIVFYISDGGVHGLEAAPSGWKGGSSDPKALWIYGTYQATSIGTGTAIGTGLSNSQIIANYNDNSLGTCAAQLCRSYNGGGKNHWFLPSKDELNQLYAQQAVVGGLAAGTYWSSSEYDAYAAWVQDFSDGSQANYLKHGADYVRPIRAF